MQWVQQKTSEGDVQMPPSRALNAFPGIVSARNRRTESD